MATTLISNPLDSILRRPWLLPVLHVCVYCLSAALSKFRKKQTNVMSSADASPDAPSRLEEKRDEYKNTQKW